MKIESSNLYDVNKTLSAQEPHLTKIEIDNRYKEVIKPFILNYSDNEYFMLLCRERNDFTIFDFKNINLYTLSNMQQDIYECFSNRGKTVSIDETEDKDAVEIWLRIDGEDFCYFLFPFDIGVIKEGFD